MNTQLVNMLHLTWEPVGVFLGNTTAACEFTPSPNKRNCVLPLLMSASRGKIIGMDEAGCTCPGGAVRGLLRGWLYQRKPEHPPAAFPGHGGACARGATGEDQRDDAGGGTLLLR